MDERKYKIVVNACLVLATVSALSFEYFSNRWIPGSLLIASAAIALSVNLYASSHKSR